MPNLSIASKTIPAGSLITAKSFLIDRILPDCEHVLLPEKEMKGGALTWQLGDITAAPEKRDGKGMRRLLGRPAPPPETAPQDRWLIDLRPNSPANWAHFLNNHLPALFAVADAADLDPARAFALLPSDIPAYIQQVATLFGITTHATDAVVTGHGVQYHLTPWGALRSARSDWVRLPAPSAIRAEILATPSDTPLPKKVFLTRSKTRALSNSTEIEAFLAARGFQTILPEALSPADQFRLFFGAEDMVAIHGAGLAPLLYCTPGQGPNRFIELFPCGHMTNVYRAIAAETGTDWIGVRGRIRPEHIPHIYKLDTAAYTAHSLDPFEVDPASLEMAFDLISAGSR